MRILRTMHGRSLLDSCAGDSHKGRRSGRADLIKGPHPNLQSVLLPSRCFGSKRRLPRGLSSQV